MRVSLALLVPVAACLAACSTIQREEVAAPPQGGSVSLRAGTPLVVSLPPDPADGGGWLLRSSSPNLLLIGGPDYTPAPKPPGLVGAADTTAFRFRAVQTGSGSLEFVWAPPPGGTAMPDRVVRYDVSVTPRIALVTDFFGTVGMESVRGGPYAPATDAEPLKVNTAPSAPVGTTPSNPVKYWSF